MATKRAIQIPNLSQFPPAQRQYLEWLRKTYPQVFSAAIRRAGIEPTGLGDIDWSGMFSSIVKGVQDVAPSLIQARQQIKLLDIQAKRAKQGLSPMSPEEYALYATPATGASVEAGGQPIHVIPRVGGITAEKWIIYGGVALGVGALIWLLARKR